MGIRLLNAIKMHSAAQDAQVAQTRWGTVQSVDPVKYVAKVLIQPENVLSGWLPVVSPWVGSGFGAILPPSQGQQVCVEFDNGDHNHGIILGSAWSASSTVPQPAKAPGGGAAPVQSGEAALVSQSGSYVVLNSDRSVFISAAGAYINITATGHIKMQDASGSSIELMSNGIISVTGNLQVSGTVIAGFGSADQVGLQTHRGHTATGGAPTPGT